MEKFDKKLASLQIIGMAALASSADEWGVVKDHLDAAFEYLDTGEVVSSEEMPVEREPEQIEFGFQLTKDE